MTDLHMDHHLLQSEVENCPDIREKLEHGSIQSQAGNSQPSNGHARLGPSNHRWPNCPGSVREEANYPDVAGEAAIDGTGSHELLELCLNNGVRADAYDGQIIATNHPDNLGGWLVSIDRCERVQMCLDYVARRVRELKETYHEVTVTAETKADIGGMFGRDDWWGTVDITITAKNAEGRVHFIEVVDYKDGRGWVHVKDNTQLLGYMGGKLRPHVATGPDLTAPFNTDSIPVVRMTIVQPKTNPVVRYEDESSAYVMLKVEELARAAALTDDPEAPLIPDSKGGKGYCRWCKHKPNCSAESTRSLETINAMSNDIIATDGQSLFELVAQSIDKVSELTNEQLTELADTEAGITSVFDKIKTEIENRIEQGQSVPGYAMQPGRASKVWSEDEDKMVKIFRARKLKQDDYYPKKLISPAQALKLDNLTADQKKKLEEQYITVKAGKMKLTRVAYEKVEKSTEMMFADVPSSLFDHKNVAQEPTPVVQSESEVSFF